MTKNVTILDEFGNRIGDTYPKRAAGLVKSGRAEYIDDCRIRMRNTHVPTVIENITEEKHMSRVIGFNARDFKFDNTCKGNNVGSRMVVTDALGNNVEIFEIGDYKYNWTQLAGRFPCGQNEDICFKFAVTGNVGSGSDARAHAIIILNHGQGKEDEDWENRYIYNISKLEYKPIAEKCWEDKILRFYDISFNTSDAESFSIVFVAFKLPLRIYPVKDVEMYGMLPDYQEQNTGYDGSGRRYFRNFNWDRYPTDDWGSAGRDLGEEYQTPPVMSDSVEIVPADYVVLDETENDFPEEAYPDDVNRMNGAELTARIRAFDDGSNLNLSGSEIYDVPQKLHYGSSADGSNLKATDSFFGGNTFCALLKKIGDGCNVDFSNSVIGDVDENYLVSSGGSIDGSNVKLENVNISAIAFCRLFSKIGDGCRLDMSNCTVQPGPAEITGGSFDGTRIILTNANIPQNIYLAMQRKVGDGCRVDSDVNIY